MANTKKECVNWLRRLTSMEKTLLSLSILLVFTLVLLLLFGIAFTGKSCRSPNSEQDGCWTTDCIELAGDLLSNMESTADSCTDFYSLSCGRYVSAASRSSSAAKEAVDSAYFALRKLLESTETPEAAALEDVKTFYNSCVQFGEYRPNSGAIAGALLELMRKLGIGVWPLLDPLYDTSAFSLEHALVSLVLLDVPVVFRMEVVPDQARDDGSYLIKISPGGPQESGRSPAEIRSDVQLRSSVLSSLLLLGVSAANTNNDVADLLAADSSFAAIEEDDSTPCEENYLAPDEAVSELNRVIPEINWAYVLAEMRRSTGLLRSSFGVQLFCKHKIQDYVVHLNDLSIRSEANYLGWRFFSKFVQHILPTFKEFRQAEPVPRWRSCVQLLERFASPLLTRALATDRLDDVRKQVDKIANSTLSVTRELVTRAGWLDEHQKTRILKKVGLLRIRSPFDKSLDSPDVQLPEGFSKVDVTNFTSAVIHLERQWVIQRFKRLAKEEKQDNGRWTPLISPAEDSAPSDFVVPVYFDRVQPPFLRKHTSPWMNFGGLGVAVATQISHSLWSFSVGASEEDSLHLWNAWTSAKSSSTCLLQSILDRSGMQNISQTTMDKLMRHLFVERSAIEIAYEAARTNAGPSGTLPGLDWSGQKMFFLSLTQSVCSVELTSERQLNNLNLRNRLNSVLLSYQPFTEAFSCSSSPECKIWAR